MALIKKLTKIGNSWGVILPGEIMEAAGLSKDSDVEISVNEHQIILRPTHLKDHKIMNTFMKVIKEYDETFQKLAK